MTSYVKIVSGKKQKGNFMNYIKKLEQENKEKDEKIEEIQDTINELRRYLNSDKFQAEQNDLQGYVNIKDVLTRLQGV